MQGIAGAFQRDVFRLAGVRFDENEPPWWVAAVMGWLAMVKQIQEGYGEVAKGYRTALSHVLSKQSPAQVYTLYKDFRAAMEAEENK